MPKRTSKNKSLIIIIFPYLFIYEKEGIEVDGIRVVPSYKDNIDIEKDEIKNQLLTIAKLFRFGRDKQIFQWSYIVSYIENTHQWEELSSKINRLSTILRYLQLSDLKDHAKFEQFNHFTFEIIERQKNPDHELSFYRGLLNSQSFYNFYLNNSVVTNPFIPFEELHPLILTQKEITENDLFIFFYTYQTMFLNKGEDQKILRAIEWFNRSFSHNGRGVDLSEALLNINTALEALVRPDDENQGVKAQIKTALRNLLGQSQQIGLWFDNFWKLRNSIVHGNIVPASLMYIHPESKEKKGHRSHLIIAREIFVKCLDSILKIRSTFPLMGFDEKLISNEVRVEATMKLLKKFKLKKIETYYQNKVFEFISGLRSDDASVGKQKVKDLGVLFLPLIQKELEENEKTEIIKEIIDKIEEIIDWRGVDLGDLALKYADLEKLYSPLYFKDTAQIIHVLALRGAAYNFFSFATWRLLTFF